MSSPSDDQAAVMALASKLHMEAVRRKRPARRLLEVISSALQTFLETSLVKTPEVTGSRSSRSCIFEPRSPIIAWWDSLLVLGVIYSAAWTPLSIVFQQARWANHQAVDVALDVLFSFDIVIRFRTAFRDHGYDVTQPLTIALNYIRGWFFVDLLSSLPIDQLVASCSPPGTITAIGSPHSRVTPITVIDIISLLRIMRIGRLVRKLSALSGANTLRIMYLMYLFILCGHWLGLVWYTIAIRPLEADETFDNLRPWLWTLEEDGAYFVAQRYICSVYWALSVMTNLKGPPAHETRQCLWHDPLNSYMVNPLSERIFTMFVFIIGCVLFSCIYGNINQYIMNLYASGLRYRKRMEELEEFAKFHRLSPLLRNKIRNYVDFQWSVTKGINVDTIASGLPAHLQVEMRLQLNKRLVEQVSIFAGCPREFFEALVSKLQPCICVAGDFVFYESEIGSRMYFIKRGIAQVGKANRIFATFKEGDYFGEVALLTDQPRTASVIAVTDLMLLSLSCADLEEVLGMFPAARVRIEAAAQERVKALTGGDSIKSKSYLLKGPNADSAPGRRGSWGMMGSLVSTSARLREPNRRESSSRGTDPSKANQEVEIKPTMAIRNCRASHRLLALQTEPCTATLHEQSLYNDIDPLANAVDHTENESTEARRTSIPTIASTNHRRPSLDSRPSHSDLEEATANNVRSMPPPLLPQPSSIRRHSAGGCCNEESITRLPEETHVAREHAVPLYVTPKKPWSRHFAFRRLRVDHKRVEPDNGSSMCQHGPEKQVNGHYVTSDATQEQDQPNPGSLRRGSVKFREQPTVDSRSGRRCSIDSGLNFEQRGLSGCTSAGVLVPGVPRRIPAQWTSLGASGASSSRRSSGGSPALRLSLDGGLIDPDEVRRRILGTQRHGPTHSGERTSPSPVSRSGSPVICYNHSCAPSPVGSTMHNHLETDHASTPDSACAPPSITSIKPHVERAGSTSLQMQQIRGNAKPDEDEDWPSSRGVEPPQMGLLDEDDDVFTVGASHEVLSSVGAEGAEPEIKPISATHECIGSPSRTSPSSNEPSSLRRRASASAIAFRPVVIKGVAARVAESLSFRDRRRSVSAAADGSSAPSKSGRRRRSIEPDTKVEEQLISKFAGLSQALTAMEEYQYETLQRLELLQKDMVSVMRRLEKLDGKWM